MSGWDDLVGPALAPLTGPFPHRSFLEIAAGYGPGVPQVLADESAAIAVVMIDGVARFAGEPNLTDYHSPLGTDLGGVVSLLVDSGATGLDLDSLPVEAADALEAALVKCGAAVGRESTESTRVIDLTGAEPDGWEELLRSKDRHEVRRKRRRYRTERGEPELDEGPEYFGDFVALHRSAAGDKGGFMTDQMESFFSDLLRGAGGHLDVLLAGGEVVAAAFGFTDSDGCYLYNSAYDPRIADLSPGIVLIDRLIGRTVARGLGRFDFLKGEETYKRRLGAAARPLYRLEVAL